MRAARLAWLGVWLGLVLGLGACSTAHYPINQPRSADSPTPGYEFPLLRNDLHNSDSLFLYVGVSGGGSRAAALGYGVLQALAEQRIEWAGSERRLFDEIDVVSGVSGGSMLAAYHALRGEAVLTRFETDFLKVDLQRELASRYLSPSNLLRLSSLRFGRVELLAELLDERLYQGATYNDLRLRGQRPFLIVTAADMTTGRRFEFMTHQFDQLCSDLTAFPIARAVAASSALPIVLSPLTLWNYRANCADPGPHDPRRYVHLLDGGLSDNLSARGPLDFIARTGGIVRGTRAASFRRVRQVVFLLVNAETAASPSDDDNANVPGTFRTVRALVDIPINRYSADSLAELRHTVAQWQEQVRSASAEERGDTFDPDVEFRMIEVSLAREPNPTLRARLMAIPTTLRLEPDDLALLTRYGADSLRASPQYQALLRALKVPAGHAAAAAP